ncbi:MAG: FAD-dependent oxidoreductase [Methanomassiliicoccales archaeon]
MTDALRNVLVIGGGIAGISSALDLADQGHDVFLVERSPSIGGRMAQLDKTFPTLDCAICILAPKMVEASRHPRIHLLTFSEITGVERRQDGTFGVTVVRKPRYVNEEKCTGCGVCIESCPTKHVTEDFNEGLGERAAIYITFPQAVPRVATIDAVHCLKLTENKCGVCKKKCPAGAINYEDEEERIEIEVGSIIVATGFDVYRSDYLRRFGYEVYRNVINSMQYERMLSASGPTKGQVLRPSDGKPPSRVGFVLCAGSRSQLCKGYCSKVCCMYATKEGVLTKEHLPESDVLMFYNDLRTINKGHEEFIRRSSEELGIQYICGLPGDIEEDEDECLRVKHHDRQTDNVMTEIIDLLVLCLPIIPSEGTEELARMLDIELNENGFVKGGNGGPVSTTAEGVFACGCTRGPDDISNTVTEAIAASAMATERSGLTSCSDEDTTPQEMALSETEPPRVGVYICSCGMNIGTTVDVDAVADYATTLPNVAHAQKCMYACSQDNQRLIQQQIRDEKLNRVLIAACSPRSHLKLFQDTCKGAGMNPNLVGFVSIRELDSWVHQHEPDKATDKARTFVRMGAANVRFAKPRDQILGAVTPSAMVLGGGIAGMSAALSIASKGFRVYLVEKSNELGGALKGRRLKDLDGYEPEKLAKHLEDAVRSKENIEVLTSTMATGVSGSIGRFVVKLGRKGMEFGSSFGDRIVDVATIVVATGAQDLSPTGLYGYGSEKSVVTQAEFERMLEGDKANKIDVVEILCAGSREKEGRTYCSQICCEIAIRDVINLKERNPSSNVYVLYRDVRTPGTLEKHYMTAAELGVKFVRYSEEDLPKVDTLGGLSVKVHDLTSDDDLLIRINLVVLATPLVPNEDNKTLSEMLKVPLSEDGFFMEAHPKLRPVDFSVDGVFVAGTAQSPKGIADSIKQGFAAGSRALVPLMKGRIICEPIVAAVDQTLCTGCARCIEACPYGAMGMGISEGRLLAEVNQLLCKGCGACSTACPCRAVSIFNFTSNQITAQIDEALADVPNSETRGIAFLCNWCAYAGADNAGVSRYQYPPEIMPIRVMCTGRVDPFHVLYALLKGADGVLIGGCHPGDCHYVIGNQLMKVKIDNLTEMIKDYGFESERVRVEWVSAAEGRRFADIMKTFAEDLKRLGPNPLRAHPESISEIEDEKGVV